MATATDDGDERDRYLLDRPQRLGIMPTWWFWSRRENWRWIRWPFSVLVAALVVALLLLEVSLLVGLPVFVVVYAVALGSVEKYIRQRAVKRRFEPASRDLDQLPAPEDDHGASSYSGS